MSSSFRVDTTARYARATGSSHERIINRARSIKSARARNPGVARTINSRQQQHREGRKPSEADFRSAKEAENAANPSG